MIKKKINWRMLGYCLSCFIFLVGLIKFGINGRGFNLDFTRIQPVAASPAVKSTTSVQVKDYKNGNVLGRLVLGNAGELPITSLASALFNAQVSNIGQIQINGSEYYLVPSDGHSLNPLLPDTGTWFWGSSANNAINYETFVTNNASGLANGSIYLRAVLVAEIQFKDINSNTIIKSMDLRNYENNSLYQPLNNFFRSILVSPTACLSINNSTGEKKSYTIVPEDGTATNPLLTSGIWFKNTNLTNGATLLDLLANYGSQIKNGTVYLQVNLTKEEDNIVTPFIEKKLDYGKTYDWNAVASLNSGLGETNDIAFCFDVTGSVAPFIQNFADALGGTGSTSDPGFIDYLKSSGGTSNRYGVTNFGDYYADRATGWFFKNDYLVNRNILGDGSGFYFAENDEQLNNVKNNIRNYRRNIIGGDYPEDSIYAAMRTISEFKWRDTAKRVLVLFTDTSSKTRRYLTVDGYPITLAGLDGLVASKNIRLIWLGAFKSNNSTSISDQPNTGVETLTNIQTHVNYNYNSTIQYNAKNDTLPAYKELLMNTVLLMNGDKRYKYTYHVDQPVYLSDGSPSSDISTIRVTPSTDTELTGMDSPSSTSDGAYFNLTNIKASQLNGKFNVHLTTVANPARYNDKTMVVIHYYRDGVEDLAAKQTLFLGPVPDVNRRTSLRAVPNFDFGVNLIGDKETFVMSNAVSSPESQGRQLALTPVNDQNSTIAGSVGDFLQTGVATSPIKRGVVLTDGVLDQETSWQLETSFNNLRTNFGQAVNDQRVKIKLDQPQVQGITDLGQTRQNSSFNVGSKPTTFTSEVINNGPAVIVAYSFNISDPASNAVGSWFINFENAKSAQLIFPHEVLNGLNSGGNLLVKGTLTWTLLNKTP